MSEPTAPPPSSTAPPARSTRGDTPAVGLVVGVLAVLAAFALSIGALVVAAGSDGGGSAGTGGAPSSAHVSLDEFAVEPAAITVAEGGTLHVSNDGAIAHDLAVVGTDARTSELPAGGSEELSLAGLAPGDYTIICTVAGHESSGMTASLTIVAGDGAAAPGAFEEAAGGADHAGHGGGSPEDWARLDAAMDETIKAFPAETEGVGNEVLEPEVLADGTKRFELTAAITEWEIAPGEVVEAWTYNGQVPGPQIFVDVGDTVEIVLHNELPMGTDMHLHGIQLENAMDGVAPLTQDLIQPGESFTYRYQPLREAVAMYHAHHHAQMAVPNGLLGMFYVGQVPLPAGQTISGRAIPEDVAVSQEIPMVLNDAGVIGYALNGKSFPATEPVVGREGDWVLIHYANEGVQIHPMHLHQMDQIVVAKDGFPLDQPYTVDTLNVAPGERYSVLVQLEFTGTWVWHCHVLPHVEREEGMFGMVTAVVVEEAATA